MWDKGRRVLVSKVTAKPITIECHLMVVKPTTQQGRLCFGLDGTFVCEVDTGRVIPFEGKLNGWNNCALEAPNDGNKMLQEVMDIMIAEQRLEHTEAYEHMSGPRHAFKRMLLGPQKRHHLEWQGTAL